MLDKNDLSQISKIVKTIVSDDSAPLKKDIKVIKKDIGTIKQDIVKIREDQNAIINFFDKAYLDLRTRVEKLEQIVSNLTS